MVKGRRASLSFPIVGIGASAGGLEALEIFFAHVPRASGLAFVVIQHLAPKHKSIMDSLLRRHTGMAVVEIADGMRVEKDRVYLSPPGQSVALSDNVLHLADADTRRGAELPIDFFFRSLAHAKADRAVCIILSGTGTDGTLGLRAVKEVGGMAMAQDEAQAKYPGMPRSAIDTGLVDFVLPLEKMPERIIAYVQHPHLEADKTDRGHEGKLHAGMQKIYTLIRGRTGHDFSLYKQATIRRRIERRMAIHQIENIGDYVRHLERSPSDVDALFKDLLIGVTRFFRDPEALDALKRKVAAEILAWKQQGATVRIWVPGCSTGEEAYSLAMVFMEVMEKRKKHGVLQVFASDIDAEAIATGRNAAYPESISADVSRERLSTFFTKEDNVYRVKKRVRECVVFAVQNVAKDPPFSKIDLISCRNVLIYMDQSLQKKILPMFHYSLNEHGILVLGTSETIGEHAGFFTPIDTRWKIYQKKGWAPGPSVLPEYTAPAPASRPDAAGMQQNAGIRWLGQKIVAEDYAPPAVLVDEKFDILHFYGPVDRYLALSSGEPSLNLLRMVRHGLRPRLASALTQAMKDGAAVTCEGVRLRAGGVARVLDIIVRPFTEPSRPQGLMIVVFKERVETKASAVERRDDGAATGHDAEVGTLEQELKATREYLQTTIEELQTSNEEMRSANEEMQSTNEELDTSKEELQSTNEELIMVNTELQHKVDELTEAGDDVSNLLASTDIASIFLDAELRIRRFTPSMVGIFHLLPADIGRPVRDITSSITGANIYRAAHEVLDSLAGKKAEVRHENGAWYSMRILPYRTADNAIDGVVITFVNITDLKRSSRDLDAAKLLAENIINSIREPFIVLDVNLKVLFANDLFYRAFKVKPKETLERRIHELGSGQWNAPALRGLLEKAVSGNAAINDYTVEHDFPGLGQKTMVLNGRLIPKTKYLLLAIKETARARHTGQNIKRSG